MGQSRWINDLEERNRGEEGRDRRGFPERHSESQLQAKDSLEEIEENEVKEGWRGGGR